MLCKLVRSNYVDEHLDHNIVSSCPPSVRNLGEYIGADARDAVEPRLVTSLINENRSYQRVHDEQRLLGQSFSLPYRRLGIHRGTARGRMPPRYNERYLPQGPMIETPVAWWNASFTHAEPVG